jgi:hypothetical protein
MTYVLKDYLPEHSVGAVVMEANWNEHDLSDLGSTLEWLKSKNVRVVLMGPIVKYDMALPRLLVLSVTENKPELASEHRDNSVPKLDSEMASLAAGSWHVPYISMYQMLCSKAACTEFVGDDVPIQADSAHLTKEGSVFAVQKLKASHLLPD